MRELIIDSFAGGGGASLGIYQALGRHPDVAVNHNADAIAMHAANHPATTHYTEDVFHLNPRQVTGGKPVGLLWASPDCKHFSRAKGGKPVSKQIRGLAWVVVKWASDVKPRVIILENVREFEEWGPLVPRWSCSCGWKGTEGQLKLCRRKPACPRCESRKVVATGDMVPDPKRKGLTFRQFVGRLRAQGYAVEWKVLNAADFGAPTHRRRLFLIARRDGEPIVWPEPTHGDPKKIAASRGDLFPSDLAPWRTAAECIDWSIPCPSIFDRKKPLAEKTLKRIALGIKRYVLDNPTPFVVDMQRENRPRGTGEPMGTVTTQDNRFNLVTPVVAPVRSHGGGRRAHPMGEPLPTVTGANRGELSLVAPVVARIGQTNGNGSYSSDPASPLTTITSKAEHLVVTPHLMRHFGKSSDAPVTGPAPTVMPGGEGKTVLIAPTLVQTGYGEREGQSPRCLDIEKPLGTVVGGAAKHALASAWIVKHFGGMVGVSAETPLPTTTARGTQNQLAVANLVHMNHGDKTCSGVDEPARTVTASGTHAALVYSFLVKYFGTAIGCEVGGPTPTVTGKDRFGLVTVEIGGEPFVIVDIGMRMLKPRELARAQGFPDSYKLTGTATNQVERIGNSVCPVMARVLAGANYTARVPVAA